MASPVDFVGFSRFPRRSPVRTVARMTGAQAGCFVAECFWPDVTEADLAALDQRLRAVAAELGSAQPFRYLGSILMREDDVVLCQFEGAAAAVRDAAERAGVPFERIVETLLTSAGGPCPSLAADA